MRFLHFSPSFSLSLSFFPLRIVIMLVIFPRGCFERYERELVLLGGCGGCGTVSSCFRRFERGSPKSSLSQAIRLRYVYNVHKQYASTYTRCPLTAAARCCRTSAVHVSRVGHFNSSAPTKIRPKMLTLYEVVANETQPGGAPYFSPFTIRARLALLHKGVEFDTRDVRYEDLVKEWKDKLGVEKATGERRNPVLQVSQPAKHASPFLLPPGPLTSFELSTVPFIQREDGTYLMDSLKIAEYVALTNNCQQQQRRSATDTSFERAGGSRRRTPIARVCSSLTPLFRTIPSQKSTKPRTKLAPTSALPDRKVAGYRFARSDSPRADDRRSSCAALHFGDLFTFWAPKFAPTFTKWDFDYWTSDERLGQGSYQRMCDTNPGG